MSISVLNLRNCTDNYVTENMFKQTCHVKYIYFRFIIYIFFLKKKINNTEEKGDQRKNSGFDVIFGDTFISA